MRKRQIGRTRPEFEAAFDDDRFDEMFRAFIEAEVKKAMGRVVLRSSIGFTMAFTAGMASHYIGVLASKFL